ncbi:MAG: hypothetical protein LBS19_00480 [Clostridiales bacterium]|nr:hypothetical protein [Clostridiales bacterium]
MDIAGCPNRCRHCWLGHEKNPRTSMDDYQWVAGQFKGYRLNGSTYFDDLIFNSWYREPDYADNYKELWELDKSLSTSPPPRFELASIWRLARDESYAPWLKSLGVDVVQVTLFGGQENTDYFSGRKGAFNDIVKSFDILINNKIAPRVQIFVYQTNVSGLINIVPLLRDVEARLGFSLDCYVTISDPMGAGYDLEDIRVTKEDLLKLPGYLVEKTMRNKGIDEFSDIWKEERELLPGLTEDNAPPNDEPDILAFMVSGDFNVYPNSGEIAPYACLGNLKSDGINAVMDNFINRKTQSLKLNHETPVSYFAKKYGDSNGIKLTDRYDLCKKWIRKEAAAKL